MKLSELSEEKRSHLAWRLDHNTACGYLTAARVARCECGDLDLVEIFMKFGDRTHRSAVILAKKVIGFDSKGKYESHKKVERMIRQMGKIVFSEHPDDDEMDEFIRWAKDYARTSRRAFEAIRGKKNADT